MFDIEEELKKLPKKPGVYIMHDKNDKIIYVGKAVVLRNRVRQYFRKNKKTKRIQNMVSLIDHFEYIVTDNEAEALILECNLIKKNMPKFNVLLKDDKTYPYIKINVKSDYPDIYITRRILNDGAKYFGPYANAGSAKEMIEFIKSKYKIRQCKSFKYKDRACLNYHIKKCLAPCMGYVTKEEYKKQIDEIIMLLEGKTKEIIKQIDSDIIKLSEKQEYEKAAELRDKEQKEKEKLEKEKKAWEDKNRKDIRNITAEDIAEVIASSTGIPAQKISQDENEKLRNLEQTLHQRVIGQNEAVDAVAKAIRRGRVGLKDPNRPIGSFLFLGPTGVGKTELSKALAESLFGNEDAMIRIDMSEYMEGHSVSKLIGSPPGYVGFDEGGQLTEKIRRKPYSVILFDEIEKAHPDVMNMLLQILDDGRLTDAQGRTVNFKNTVIIMTSNIGARLITDKTTLGFSAKDKKDESQKEYETIKKDVMGELKKQFRPEFINRIDEIIVFHKLNDEDIKQIIDIMLNQVTKRMAEKSYKFEIDNSVKELIAKKGVDTDYGARPLKRAIQNILEDKIAEEILDGNIKPNKKAVIKAEDDKIVIS